MKNLLIATSFMMLASTAAYAGGSHESANGNYNNNNNSKDYTNHQSTWYVSASGIGNFLEDSDIGATSAEYDTGYGVLIATGIDLDFGYLTGMRGELELGWRENDVDSVGAVGASGNLDSYSAMANLYYDFENTSRFKPYIGGGIGAAQISADNISVAGANLDDEDTVFAYQGMAGIGYEICPRWTLNLEYRYFATNDASMTDSAGVNGDVEYSSHNAIVGLKYDLY